ncbi:MAG: DUF4292 domain-containing protein [Bergeyella sp.]
MKSFFSIIVFSFLIVSCTVKKPVSESPVDVNNPVAGNTFFSEISKPASFEQVKINSKVNIETGSFIPTLDATIYIENDEKVWMNITALFLNMGRGIATKDGIKGYEKWNKTYIDSDFTYLNNLLNVNFIDFKALQNLLIGKTFIPVSEKDFILTENAQGFTLNSKKNQTISKDEKVSEYKITLDYSAEKDLKRVLLNEVRKNETLEITYSDWISEANNRFPKNVKIIIKNKKTSQLLIENTTFAFVRMETPYSVPANYKKTDIK